MQKIQNRACSSMTTGDQWLYREIPSRFRLRKKIPNAKEPIYFGCRERREKQMLKCFGKKLDKTVKIASLYGMRQKCIYVYKKLFLTVLIFIRTILTVITTHSVSVRFI